jgi:GNAT superfamily N-acetyltransferase
MQTIQNELGTNPKSKIQNPKSHSAIYMPVNLSIWHNYRFKTRGNEWLPFESPTLPYYSKLFSGFLRGKEFYSSYRLRIPRFMKGRATNPRYSVKTLSPDDPLRDLRIIYDLSAQIFESVHSVPSFEEFQAIYSGAARSTDPRYTLLAEEDGAHVGLLFSVKQANKVYVKTLAVLPNYQGRGVGRLLYETLCARALDDGCDTLYGLTMRNDRLISRLVPPGAKRVAEYMLYKES